MSRDTQHEAAIELVARLMHGMDPEDRSYALSPNWIAEARKLIAAYDAARGGERDPNPTFTHDQIEAVVARMREGHWPDEWIAQLRAALGAARGGEAEGELRAAAKGVLEVWDGDHESHVLESKLIDPVERLRAGLSQHPEPRQAEGGDDQAAKALCMYRTGDPQGWESFRRDVEIVRDNLQCTASDDAVVPSDTRSRQGAPGLNGPSGSPTRRSPEPRQDQPINRASGEREDAGAPMGFPGKVTITDYHGPAPHQDVERLSPDADTADIEINEKAIDRLRERETEIEHLRGALELIASDECMIKRAPQRGTWIDVGEPQRVARAALAPSPDDRPAAADQSRETP